MTPAPSPHPARWPIRALTAAGQWGRRPPQPLRGRVPRAVPLAPATSLLDICPTHAAETPSDRLLPRSSVGVQHEGTCLGSRGLAAVPALQLCSSRQDVPCFTV